MSILGLYAGHDANAALVRNGSLVAATEEERVSRKKHHLGTPDGAMRDVLSCGGYDTVAVATPHQEWMKVTPDVIVDHHLAHAYYTYALSGFERAVVLTADGGGDRSWAAVYRIDRGRVDIVNESSKGRPFGNLYARTTEALGFRTLHDEGKVMGLAGHGNPAHCDGLYDGSYTVEGGRLVAEPGFDWEELLGQASQEPREHVAAALQAYFERILLEWVEANVAPEDDLCVSGGVFANVQLNGKLLTRCNRLFVAPAMGDGGLGAGAALYAARDWGHSRPDMFLGYDIGYVQAEPHDLARRLRDGEFVALAYGRMEHGPRALGHRSILADPRDWAVVDGLNNRLGRIEFMPFAPVILADYAGELLEGYAGLDAQPSARHMTLTYQVKEEWRKMIPAVVHVDGTARPQVIDEGDGFYYQVVHAFYELTGCPLLVNTSLNMHGEPIVRMRQEAAVVAGKAGLYLT